MKTSQIGAVIGVLIGLVLVFGGWWQALVVVLLGLVGFIVGRIIDGELDVHDLFGTGSNRRNR
ncbi:MAG: DUF2273 domain-containing protein [Acidipropionibacterium sp.]|jgi:uncharacterized membrane protein|nr:DUF2273 domain-containing protein [Acidipropionibacterium sp.]